MTWAPLASSLTLPVKYLMAFKYPATLLIRFKSCCWRVATYHGILFKSSGLRTLAPSCMFFLMCLAISSSWFISVIAEAMAFTFVLSSSKRSCFSSSVVSKSWDILSAVAMISWPSLIPSAALFTSLSLPLSLSLFLPFSLSFSLPFSLSFSSPALFSPLSSFLLSLSLRSLSVICSLQ